MSDQASTRTMLQPHAAEPAPPVAKGILQCCGEPGCSGCEVKAPYLRTPAEPGHAVAGRVPSIVNEVLAAPGQSLPPDVRSFFEPRFGHDFSHVHVHANARAAESARVVGALAYTVGQQVVFGEGRYEPGLARGRRLLAHELQHVLQQGGASSTTVPAVIGDPHSALEAEAESAAGIGADEGVAGAPYAAAALGTEVGPTGAAVLRRQPVAPAAGARAPAPAAAPAGHEVTAIRLDHQESGGLGRFDALLYRDCSMKVQFRMNFNFLGPWPNEQAKRDWQARFIASVRAAWSRQFSLEAVGACRSGCRTVRPFIEIYAPHSAPHVTVDVTYNPGGCVKSSAGYGHATLDSLDLTPMVKREPWRQTPAVHEFGHLVGRADLYQAGTTKCVRGYPGAGVICHGSTVTKEDYQPFANALREMTGCTYRVGSAGGGALGAILGGLAGGLVGAVVGLLAGGPVGVAVGGAAGLALRGLLGGLG